MSKRRAGGIAGTLAALAVGVGLVAERTIVAERRKAAPDADRLGTLHSQARTVIASDGVHLHAEVDEVAPYSRKRRGKHEAPAADLPTLVFAHGYALSLDCWHFQRAALRGKFRMVFYDQRAHGQSGRGEWKNATIDQLGADLGAVIEQLVPTGRVVVVGHSMGGMSALAYADQFTREFSERVTGVALIATSAGDMHPHETISSWIPDGIGEVVALRAISALAKAPELVDSARRLGSNIGYLVVRRFAFGSTNVPPEQVEFLDHMLADTPMEVLGAFFPQFEALDKYAVLGAFTNVATTIICGTRDRLTPLAHSRRLATAIEGSELVVCPGAGHMVIFEKSARVNAAIESVAIAAARPDLRAVASS
ncbi:MAG: alpha/beta hydrolase [Marmoricola sp.]